MVNGRGKFLEKIIVYLRYFCFCLKTFIGVKRGNRKWSIVRSSPVRSLSAIFPGGPTEDGGSTTTAGLCEAARKQRPSQISQKNSNDFLVCKQQRNDTVSEGMKSIKPLPNMPLAPSSDRLANWCRQMLTFLFLHL